MIAHTLSAARGAACANAADLETYIPVPFDTTQITSAANYSNPQPGDPCHPLAAGAHAPAVVMTLAIRGRGDSHDLEIREDGTANALLTPNGGRGGLGVGAVAFSCKDHGADAGDIAPTLRSMGHDGSHANGGGQVAVAFHPTQDPISSTDGSTHAMGTGLGGGCATVAVAVSENGEIASTLRTGGNDHADVYNSVATAMQVRRLTPVECARLQGFPDTYLDIAYRGKPAADGPKYKALGNSMAVPVMN